MANQNIGRSYASQTLTIANGATTSDAVNAQDCAMFGLIMPATFTGTALTFTVCDTQGGTYQALYDTSNTAVTLGVVAVSRSYDLPVELCSWPFWKVVSGSSEGGARSIVIVKKG